MMGSGMQYEALCTVLVVANTMMCVIKQNDIVLLGVFTTNDFFNCLQSRKNNRGSDCLLGLGSIRTSYE
jgi:hypothetical protein